MIMTEAGHDWCDSVGSLSSKTGSRPHKDGDALL